MSDLELCRLCANFADDTNSRKLFERNQRNLLRLAEELLGIELQNAADLPQFICDPCQEQTMQAHEFREQCIRVQEQFANATALRIQIETSTSLATTQRKPPTKHKVIAEAIPEEEELISTENEFLMKIETHDFKLIEEVDEQEELFEEVELNDEQEELFEELGDDDEDEDEYMPSPESGTDDSIRVMNEAQNTDDEDSSGSCYSLSFDYPDQPDDTDATSDLITLPPPKHPDDIKLMEKVALLIEKAAPRLKKRDFGLGKPKNEKSSVCEQCGEHLRCQYYLNIHMRKHTGEKPFACKTCDSRFISKSYLIKHERIHDSERHYVCRVCGKAFKQASVLNSHSKIHTGSRPFKCATCNVAYRRNDLLKAHLNSQRHKSKVEKQKKFDSLVNNSSEDGSIREYFFEAL